MRRVEITCDDALLVANYRRHWLDMGITPAEVRPDWEEEAYRFLAEARRDRGLVAFVALVDDKPVGTACCHIVERSFPAFRTADAGRLGYIWGVYVEPGHRGDGLGALLVTTCMSHLRTNGCGRALLHAGERARPLYDRLNFRPTDELAAPL